MSYPERLGPVKAVYLGVGAAIGALIGVFVVNTLIHQQRTGGSYGGYRFR